MRPSARSSLSRSRVSVTAREIHAACAARPALGTGRRAARVLPWVACILASLGMGPVDAQRITILDDDDANRSSSTSPSGADEAGQDSRLQRSKGTQVTVSREGEGVNIRISSGDDSLRGEGWNQDEGKADVEQGRTFVAGDKVVFGQDLTVSSDKIISGDAVAILGSIEVQGSVRGDVVSIGGDITLRDGAIVRGDCVAVGGGSIRAATGSQIHGEAVTVGGHIVEDQGAHLARRVEMSFVPAISARPGLFFRGGWWIFLSHLIFIGVIGLILAKLGSRRWENAVLSLKARALESLLAGVGAGIVYGILGLPLLIVIIVALVALVIGIPLVPLVFFLVLIFPIPGYLVTGATIGSAMRRSPEGQQPGAARESLTTAFLIGHAALSLPWFLAVLLRSLIGAWYSVAGAFLLLGWGIIWLAIAFGWGAFLLSRFGKRLPPALQALAGAVPQPPVGTVPSGPAVP
jgi:hypothetical protein